MGYKTSVCFLLLAMLSGFQVCSGSIISDTIEALERAVHSYINTTLVAAQEIATSVEKGVTRGVEDAEVFIRNMIHGTLSRVSAVRECSAQASKELANTRTSSRTALRECIHPSAHGIREAIGEFGGDLGEISQAVRTSFLNLTSCGLNLRCDLHTLQEAQAKSWEIRFNIANHFLDLQRAALVAGRNGSLCVQKVTYNTRQEIQAIAGEAIVCASSSSSTEHTSTTQ